VDGVSGTISERAVTFGLNDSLVGIITQASRPDPTLPVVVAINGGILVRAGQGRVYVSLARRLAALGYRMLRFDLSGIGDSLTRGDGLSPGSAAVDDICLALDFFATAGERVVLLGLCDGATLAAHRASIDPRVVGAMLIDPLIPRTARYRRLHFQQRLAHRTTWSELADGSHPLWRKLKMQVKGLAFSDNSTPSFDPNSPAVYAGLEAVYRGLVDNDVEVFSLFTGGMQHRHCYREQLLDAFPAIDFGPRLRLEYFPSNDHHLEWPPHRAWLLDQITGWLQSAPFRDRPER
jgi:pimeloyl-ACP methyl ester carboxylesterase